MNLAAARYNPKVRLTTVVPLWRSSLGTSHIFRVRIPRGFGRLSLRFHLRLWFALWSRPEPQSPCNQPSSHLKGCWIKHRGRLAGQWAWSSPLGASRTRSVFCSFISAYHQQRDQHFGDERIPAVSHWTCWDGAPPALVPVPAAQGLEWAAPPRRRC